jgi:phosphoserine phosphatase RsbU/P
LGYTCENRAMRFLSHTLVAACILLAPISLLAIAQPPVIPGRGLPSNESSPAAFSFTQDRELVISLDGRWRFHQGDDSRWAASSFDDSSWPLLFSNQPWATQGYAGLSGFAWYRFRVQAPLSQVPLALQLPSILTDYEVFQDGRKIGGFGRMPPHGSLRFNRTLLYNVAPVQPGASVEFAIRVWHHPILATYLGGGSRYSGARMGARTLMETQFRALQAERLIRVVSFFAIGVLDAVISITVFGLYFYRRSEREYFWFAVLLLCGALSSILTIANFIFDFPLGVGDFLAETFGAIQFLAALLFFSNVLEIRISLVARGVLLLALLDPANVLAYLFRWVSPATSTTLRILFDVPIETYILVLLCQRTLKGNRNARLLLAPTILVYGTGLLGGLLLLSFQLGWRAPMLDAVSRWNVFEAPFPVPLQTFVQLIFVVALLTFLIRRFALSRAREERYSADMEAARTLQHVLIPEELPSIAHIELSTAYHPAQEVGGDFYQILPLPAAIPNGPPDTLVVLGDVAGKGLPAAMTVSLLVGALRTLVETTDSPGEILAGLNRRLWGRGSGFTTCLSMRISPSGALTFANAGHLAPYHNGQELTSQPALPLGLIPEAVFPETRTHLVSGDRLTLLTDGVPEATHRGELFGFERTAGLSMSPAAAIAEAALSFGQADDITVISIIRT